jgi:predicted DNA-binding mobile mystery protein A
MKKTRLAAQSRAVLDNRFNNMRPVDQFARPVRGWIKAIRQALGMSSAQLAKRLGMKQPSLAELEQSEAKGTIQLSTLRRVAEALDCKLVYSLVPNQPLENMVHERARQKARRRLASVDHTMMIENQRVPAKDFEARLDELARDIKPRTLWDDE